MPRGVKSEVGATNVAANGYHYTRTEDGWKLTHHILAEQILQRPLRSDESVRFRDGDKQHLSLENILITPKKQSLRGRLAVVQSKIRELQAEEAEILQRMTKLKGSNGHAS